MDTKFSVITVTYNSEKTVRQTIESVLNQSYTNLEYILVDGCSTDRTVEIIKTYAEKDERVHFISEPDNGIYDAMNKGIRMATGDAIGLLNSDDFYEPDALQSISKYVPETQNYVVYGMVRMLKDERETMVTILNHENLPERMIMHPACFVSAAVYKKYQYDTKYKSAADYDLFLKLYQDKDISFVPVYEIIADFRLGGMSSSVVSFIESNDIRYKYGYITRGQRDFSNLGVRIKRSII